LPVITTNLSAPDSLQSFVLTIDFGIEVDGFDVSLLDLANATVVGEITNAAPAGPLTAVDEATYHVTLQPVGFGPVEVTVFSDAAETETGATNADGTSTSVLVVEERSLVVTTNARGSLSTDGLTSLEEAIAYANSDPDHSIITFDAALDGAVISGVALTLSSDVTISGDVGTAIS